MTRPQLIGLVAAILAIAVILDLVRRRHLRERYAALWLVVGAGIGVLGVFPDLLDRVAGWLGVADPPNLLFFVAILVLLVVIVQLSFELSRQEDRIRRLAEDLAILREEVTARDEDPPPG